MKPKHKPTDGLRDIEAMIEHFKEEEKKARRAGWLRQNYSKSNNKQKGGSNEDISQP